MTTTEEDRKKPSVKTYISVTCFGGPIAGRKVRLYCDNPKDVRNGGKPIYSDVPFEDGVYEPVGKELHWLPKKT
jgi:hypothetical protein